MTTTDANRTSLPLAGGACIVGAAKLTAVAVVTQVVQAITGASITSCLFPAGSELLPGGAAIRAGIWRDWRRFTPLAGPCSAILIGLQFTPAPPTAVAVYGLCFVTVGIALATGQRRARPTTRVEVLQA